eukprot:6210780-Pleurochrysis_carterae.AAC.2
MTATRIPWFAVRTCRNSVVFPAPRNPLITLTGVFRTASSAIVNGIGRCTRYGRRWHGCVVETDRKCASSVRISVYD